MIKKIVKKLFRQKKFKNVEIMAGSMVDDLSSLGEHTYVGFNCLITKAIIGRYVSIANNVSIGPGEHDIYEISTSSLFYENPYEQLTKKDVVIGNDVWIAANSVIRRGVTIGDGAVIGANSFVNSDVPSFAVFAGTPAKLIKFRFDEDKIKKIQESKWWNLDLDAAREKIKKFKS